MKPLLWLSNVFINTFGITQPTPSNANRMAVLICLLLMAVLVVVVCMAFLLKASFHA